MGTKIHVNIRTFASLRESLPSQFTLALGEGSSIKDLFQEIFAEYPEAKKQIKENTGNDFYSNYIILKNGRNITHINKEDTILEEDDTISIFPPIGGGVLPLR